MFNLFSYDFGYTWWIRYAMLVPLLLAGALATVAALRSWSRLVYVPLVIAGLWSVAAVVTLNAMLNRTMALPTDRFLTTGSGRVLDVGAGSGRAAIGVLLAVGRVLLDAPVPAVDVHAYGPCLRPAPCVYRSYML